MVTRVEKTATSAATRGERKREAQTTQQQEAKRLGIEPCLLGGWETSERLSAHGATLRHNKSQKDRQQIQRREPDTPKHPGTLALFYSGQVLLGPSSTWPKFYLGQFLLIPGSTQARFDLGQFF